LLSPPSPHQPEQERNAIDAAKRVGVGHVVALSVLGRVSKVIAIR
jgi:hypothetical protein